MSTPPQVFIDVSKINAYHFTNTLSNDAIIKTSLSNQRILIGTQQSANSALFISSNVTVVNNTLSVNTNNPLANLDVNGNIIISKPNGHMGLNAYLSNNSIINVDSNLVGLSILNDSNQTKFITTNRVGISNDIVSFYENCNVTFNNGVKLQSSNSSISMTVSNDSFLNITNSHQESINNGLISIGYGKIGVNTSNPQANIDIYGDLQITKSNGSAFTIIGSNNNAASMQILDNGDFIMRPTSASQKMFLQVGSQSNYANGLTINSNNFIGIGNSNPQVLLDIGDGVTKSQLRINNSGGDKIYLSDNIYGPKIWHSNNQLSILAGASNTQTPGVIAFHTNSNYVETMRLDGVGNLGVGTIPNHRLDIGGDINFTGILRKNGDEYIAGTPGWSNASNAIYSYCNIGIGKIPNSNWKLDVDGTINFTGDLLLNGYKFLDGGLASNFNAVSRFQVVPTNKVFLCSNLTQSNFTILVQGNVAADPQNIYVTMNGMKLSYVDGSNYDFKVTTSSPNNATTQFDILLNETASVGDVVDITVWPYLPSMNGIFLGYSNFDDITIKTFKVNSSNIYAIGSNIGIGTSNPQYSLDIATSDGIVIPKGSSGQRPSTPTQGLIRYNTSINTFEGFGAGNAWGSLGGVKDTNQDTYISAESYPTSNDDNLVFYNSNVERMRITSNGNIGIGTSNPLQMLHVDGKTYIKDELYVNSNIRVAGNILPSSNEIYDLGASNTRFKDLYLSGNTIFLGDVKIQRHQNKKGITIVDSNDSIDAATTNMITLSNYGEISLHTSNNNFGIGTSNPLYKVHMAGKTYIQDDVIINSNLNVNRGIVMQGVRIQKNQGGLMNFSPVSVPGVSNDAFGFLQLYSLYSQSNLGIRILTGVSNEVARITGDGRFGIGTSNPDAKLDINGGIRISGHIIPSSNEAFDLGTSNLKFKDLYLSGSTINLGDVKIQSVPTGGITILDSNNKTQSSIASSLTLSNYGQITLHTSNNRFGVNTQNPSVTLDINGSTKISSNLEVLGDVTIRGVTTSVDSTTVNIVDNIIRLNNGANFFASLQAGLEVNRGTGYSNYYFVFDEPTDYFKVGMQGSLQTVATRDDSPPAFSVPYYDTTTSKYSSCNLFTYSNGNLGIGSTTPSERLYVAGKIFTTNQHLGYSGDTSNIPSFTWTDDSNTGMYHPAEDNMAFVTGGVERVRILSTGNFGIGTINPSTPLQVNGTATATLFSGSGSNLTTLNASSLSYGTALVTVGGTGATSLTTSKVLVGNGTNAILQPTNLHWDNTNTRLGIGNAAPGYPLEVTGAIYASGDITAMSDMRYKANIKPITKALETTLNLNGYRYTRKDYKDLKEDKERIYIGLLAQETQNILPEVVTYDRENDKYGLNYGSLTALIIEAIKDMRKEYTTKIERLESIIKSQQEKINTLLKDTEVLVFKK